MVPEGWKHLYPVELVSFFSGFAFSSKDSTESGCRWLKIANVGIGRIKWETESYLPENYAEEHEKFLLQKGDVVVAMTRPTLGNQLKVARLESVSDQSLLNQRVAKLVTTPLGDADYIYQVFRTESLAHKINQALLGTDPPNLSVSILRKFKLPVPPLPEQKKIAKILSTWDEAIVTTEQLLANSQQQKKALMQQLLTGKKRFPGFEGEWKLKRLQDIGKIVSGGTPSTSNSNYWDEGVLWVTPTDVTALSNRYISSTKRTISEEGLKNSSAKEAPAGSVLVCTRATIGWLAITTKRTTTNQGFKNVIPNKEIEADFLYYLLTYNKHNLIRFACGSTFLELSKKDFERIKFSFPSLEEQKKISATLISTDSEITSLQQKLDRLKEEKKALMQQLLTGKRRVKIEKEVAECQ